VDGSAAGSAPSLPQFDAEAMAQLEGMGFPTVRCQKALLATGNSGAEVAMEWLFNHMEDPGKRAMMRARSDAEYVGRH
jgi:ubiquitin carboxyl-terminal hydrolase 5/13